MKITFDILPILIWYIAKLLPIRTHTIKFKNLAMDEVPASVVYGPAGLFDLNLPFFTKWSR